MAIGKTTTKPRRRSQPAKPAIRIEWDKLRRLDYAPSRRRKLLYKAVRAFDDEAVSIFWSFALSQAQASQDRADLAELARIKRDCAIIPAKKVPMRELIPLKRKSPAKRRARS